MTTPAGGPNPRSLGQTTDGLRGVMWGAERSLGEVTRKGNIDLSSFVSG